MQNRSAPEALAPFAAGDLLSLAERTYRRLRDAVVDGDLPGGTRVSERELGRALGVSAQPVREALRRLEAEGLVTTAPRRGTVVAAFDAGTLAEMSLVRAGLEATVAALAARRATAADVAALRAQLRAMRAATASGDVPAVAAANERFHDLLREVAGNVFLTRALGTLRAYDQLARLQVLGSSAAEPARALREHALLLAALRRGDPDLAEARMRAHVRRSLKVGGILETLDRPRPLPR